MNPFSKILDRLRLDNQAQGKLAYLYSLLVFGQALHIAAGSPAWNSRSLTAGDEVLFRFRSLGISPFALAEIEQFFQENVK